LRPGETKIFSHFWFPVRDIGVWDYASLEGSINLELNDGKTIFGWSPTGVHKDAKISVAYDGVEIFSKVADAGPADPFLGEATGPGMTDLYKLKMAVLSSTGDTLLAFHHEKPEHPPLPQPAVAPPDPEQVSSQDLLFIYGDRFYRYDDPSRATAYFLEALARDPGDLRANTSLGELAMKRGSYLKALEHFNKAIERDETFFKAWYYKGMALLNLGNLKDAEKCLNRATYGQDWYAIAHFELARLMASQGRLDLALVHIDNSIRGNEYNSQAQAVKALVLIRMGRYDEAQEVARESLRTDPLDLFTKQLQVTAAEAAGAEDVLLGAMEAELLELTRADAENHIEMAIRFARCGDYANAIKVLELSASESEDINLSPMLYYYQAYYYKQIGDSDEAGNFLKRASGLSSKHCFPYRLETFPVLEWAISENPEDAQAYYLLGNLLKYSQRNEEAIAHWEKSVELDPVNVVAQRNLGQVYYEEGDLPKARTAYLAAIKAEPTAGRAIVELGLINWELKLPFQEQIAMFEDNIKVVQEYNQAVSQLVLLYILTDRNAEALKLLNSTHFNSWEGKYGIHQTWVQANLKQGDTEYEEGHYKEALSNYRQSLLYPDNLEVAEQPNTIHARKRYKIGKALEALGRKDEAREYYELVIADKVEDGNAYQYYRARAMEALKQKQEARRVYEKMLESLDGDPDASSNAVSLFTRSLALEGLGKKKEAETDRNRALDLNPLVEISSFRPPRSGF
jgi:tetratricopeptide (TPR) repeat protein